MHCDALPKRKHYIMQSIHRPGEKKEEKGGKNDERKKDIIIIYKEGSIKYERMKSSSNV